MNSYKSADNDIFSNMHSIVTWKRQDTESYTGFAAVGYMRAHTGHFTMGRILAFPSCVLLNSLNVCSLCVTAL